MKKNVHKPKQRKLRFQEKAAASLSRSSLGDKGFTVAASRVIPTVNTFSENYIARLVRGKVVSEDPDYAQVSDVHVKKLKMTVQVKACSRKKDARPSLEQIERTHRVVHNSFLWDALEIRRGFYAVVFYKSDRGNGKSLLVKRGMSEEEKQMIIAEGIQCVYFLDIRFVHHLSTAPEFAGLRTNGSSKLWAERKLKNRHSRFVLRLKRKFLHPMVDAPELSMEHRQALDTSLGVSGWKIQEEHVRTKFRTKGSSMTRSVPVRIIGARKNVQILQQELGKRQQFVMDLGRKGKEKEPDFAL